MDKRIKIDIPYEEYVEPDDVPFICVACEKEALHPGWMVRDGQRNSRCCRTCSRDVRPTGIFSMGWESFDSETPGDEVQEFLNFCEQFDELNIVIKKIHEEISIVKT